ncbi:hypothetical protein ACHWQZ_G018426 [Mnemiopsis leidyi]
MTQQSEVEDYIESCANKTVSYDYFEDVYKCIWGYLCDETNTNNYNFDSETLWPFKDFCAFKECYETHDETNPLIDLEQPCFRYKCIENSPWYKEFSWCGFVPTNPRKLILPLVLIAALCSIVFYMAYASCRERSQRIKYMKSQNSYGKLKNDQANNKH